MSMINSCPRFEDKVSALNWLASTTPAFENHYRVFAEIAAGDQINGIPVFSQSVADELSKFKELPLWFDGELTLIPVDPQSLFWEVDTELDDMLESELDITLDPYYAATSLLNSVIELNVSATFVCSSLDERSFQKSLQIYMEKLDYLQAGILKMAASNISESYVIRSLRARHMTINKNYRNFYVPAQVFGELLVSISSVKHMIVIDGDYAYCLKSDGVAKILSRLGLNVEHIVECGKGKMYWLLEHIDFNKDTVISHVFRHPIIGYVAVGSTKPAEIDGIGVPADISQKLDGDDDGDIIDLVPSIVIKNKTLEFVTTILD